MWSWMDRAAREMKTGSRTDSWLQLQFGAKKKECLCYQHLRAKVWMTLLNELPQAFQGELPVDSVTGCDSVVCLLLRSGESNSGRPPAALELSKGRSELKGNSAVQPGLSSTWPQQLRPHPRNQRWKMLECEPSHSKRVF